VSMKEVYYDINAVVITGGKAISIVSNIGV
jgi:hypothetical protein